MWNDTVLVFTVLFGRLVVAFFKTLARIIIKEKKLPLEMPPQIKKNISTWWEAPTPPLILNNLIIKKKNIKKGGLFLFFGGLGVSQPPRK